jgi:signal peptidase I
MDEFDEEPTRRVEIDDALASRLSQVRKREHIRGLRKREWVFLSFFLVLAIAAYANFERVIVTGHSMEPTYHNHETLVMWKLAPRNRLKRGDVIVFRQGRDELIKRILYICPPGQSGKYPPPGFPQTYINPEGWRIPADAPPWMTFQWYFLKIHLGITPPPPLDQTIYVMGDNFPISDDSRDYGPISPSQILGRIIQ